jgi:hypothetical protein
MNKSKEIVWGVLWGVTAGLLLSMLLFSIGESAEPENEGGIVDISISADSVTIVLDKDGLLKTVTLDRNEFTKTDSGIVVKDEIIIEDGKIYIDGIELTEEELERLSVDKEEEKYGLELRYGDREDRIIRRERLATVYTDTDDDVVKFGDIVIEDNLRVRGDVVSIGGDITVYGKVRGDVVSVFGDVFLEGDAYIEGDVTAPFGTIFQDDDVIVEGDKATVTEFKSKKHKGSFGVGARFNRVEGFTLGPSLRYESKYREYPTLELNFAYAFTLKRWEYDLLVEHKLGNVWGPSFSGRMYRVAETSDRWLMPWEAENSFAGIFLKEDFYDFYWMRGFSGSIGIWYGENLELGVLYTGAKIETLEKTAEKAIFGGKKKFRENWSTVLPDSAAILGMEGDLKEFGLSATFDTRDDELEPSSGLFASVSYAQTADSDSGDFDYRKIDAEFKAYYPMTSDQTFFFRFRGGYSDDDLPLFRRYFLGGIGSLRGYKYKEFEGNRYILFNVDYIWRFFDSNLGAGVFFDGGKAAFSGGDFESAEFKTDAGIALLIGDFLRLNMAQRLDDIDKSPVLSARAHVLF